MLRTIIEVVSIFRAECESQVKGFKGAAFKKFNTLAEAQSFITSKGGVSTTTSGSGVSGTSFGSRLFNSKPVCVSLMRDSLFQFKREIFSRTPKKK